MKRLFVNFMTCAAMATALTLAACSSDSDGEGNGNGNGGNGEGTGSSIVVGDNILSGTLTGEQTLESKEYILNGTVIVADGGRLNIPAGTTGVVSLSMVRLLSPVRTPIRAIRA